MGVVLPVVLAACGGSGEQAATADPVWLRDSALVASHPGVVFRTIEHPLGRAVVPITLMGGNAFQRIRLSERGWRAFDSSYLYKGKTLRSLRDGRAGEEVRLTRGMWESIKPLDSLPGCPRVVPAGLADVPRGVSLLVSSSSPTVKAVQTVSSGAVSEALAAVPTLVAPLNGIKPEFWGRYSREVRLLPTGSTSRSTILAIYTDPQAVSDTVNPLGVRPRQLVVVLDQGNYGYRTSFAFKTLGNAQSPPRLEFLDHVDVDGDGRTELFFNTMRNGKYETTLVLRYGTDQEWREVMNEMVRCQI